MNNEEFSEQQEDTMPPEEVAAEPVSPEVPAAPPKSRRLRKVLLWAVLVVGLVAIGAGATWYLRVAPQDQTLRELRTDMAGLQEQVEALQAEVETLRPLKEENRRLKARVEDLENHQELLQVLVDVTTAQLEMMQEEPVKAAAALEVTDQRLARLEQRLTGAAAKTIAGLRERLALALQEIETNDFAARRDLEVLANDILALGRDLFGQ